jgi:hypothetical protein
MVESVRRGVQHHSDVNHATYPGTVLCIGSLYFGKDKRAKSYWLYYHETYTTVLQGHDRYTLTFAACHPS